MADPGETSGSPWPPLVIRLRVMVMVQLGKPKKNAIKFNDVLDVVRSRSVGVSR
jgi:hypothetical protein